MVNRCEIGQHGGTSREPAVCILQRLMSISRCGIGRAGPRRYRGICPPHAKSHRNTSCRLKHPIRVPRALFHGDFGKHAFQFLQSLGGIDFVEAGMVVKHASFGADDDPERELSALVAGVTEGFQK